MKPFSESYSAHRLAPMGIQFNLLHVSVHHSLLATRGTDRFRTIGRDRVVGWSETRGKSHRRVAFARVVQSSHSPSSLFLHESKMSRLYIERRGWMNLAALGGSQLWRPQIFRIFVAPPFPLSLSPSRNLSIHLSAFPWPPDPLPLQSGRH